MLKKKKQNKNKKRKRLKFNIKTIDFKKQLQKIFLMLLFFGFQTDQENILDFPIKQIYF